MWIAIPYFLSKDNRPDFSLFPENQALKLISNDPSECNAKITDINTLACAHGKDFQRKMSSVL